MFSDNLNQELITENYGSPSRPQGFGVSVSNAARTVNEIRARAERLFAQVWCGHDVTQFMSLRHSTEGWYK